MVADEIERWYDGRAMDLILLRQEHPAGFENFNELVIPILQKRGIFRGFYQADRLRGNLDLLYIQNRYAEKN
ncbi:hypothetical protein [Peribacillus frigoritolerans]|uniref:hypothetical protein n=1 Tax=Peribacillus frigoritolerans TaxID=450367 RepID=UPI00227ECE7C|nr:hypothetical protein [Peribacillus frigoritolerans]MCY9007292.1 hypothetical protein [Peribacillus frigoritolerans]